MASETINSCIAGTGMYVPETVLTNDDLAERFHKRNKDIYTMTGIKERHIADESQATSDLGLIAAERAIISAGIDSSDVDLIILSTLSPDYHGTATACIIEEGLGIRNKPAFDISAACSGFVYSLAVGNQFITSGIYNTILVIGADVFSRMTDQEDYDSSILSGDGAGAVVLRPAPAGSGIISIHLGADGSGIEHLYVPAGGSRMAVTADNIAANLNKAKMNGQEIFRFAMCMMPETIENALRIAGIGKEDVALFIPHQANLRIIEAAARRMELPMDKFMINLDRYGNTSSASIPIALDEALKSGRIEPDNVVVLTGFGGGLAWGSVVIRWQGTETSCSNKMERQYRL